MMGFEQVKLIELPKICDPRGNLSFIENGGRLPFELARTYWVYDVPGGKKRFGHAFGFGRSGKFQGGEFRMFGQLAFYAGQNGILSFFR